MKRLLLAAALLALTPSLAAAQSKFPPIAYPNAVGNFSTPGFVQSFLDATGHAVPAGANSPIPTMVTPLHINGTKISGHIDTGGSWLLLAGPFATRVRFQLQNPCSSTTEGIASAESIFISLGDTTAPIETDGTGAWEVTPCGIYTSPDTVVGNGNIWVLAATSKS